MFNFDLTSKNILDKGTKENYYSYFEYINAAIQSYLSARTCKSKSIYKYHLQVRLFLLATLVYALLNKNNNKYV